jgi:hypothetical protein
LDLYQLLNSITVGFISVIWIEFVKWYKRSKMGN